MDNSAIIKPPKRVTDLIELKKIGYDLDINLSFDIVPVNFAHKNVDFQAYIFLCRYSGMVNNKAFSFRKCYARGCPHNLCPHVAQAVMIANRYLKKDYKRLWDSGVTIAETLFSLEDMVLKYEELDHDKNEKSGGILIIHDYINIAKEGNRVEIETSLEIIPAVEHFANEKNEQTFLMADFNIMTLGRKNQFQRCFGCFQSHNESVEKPGAVTTANERLKILYQEFDDARVIYRSVFFN